MLMSQGCCTNQMRYLRKYLALSRSMQLLDKYLSSFLTYPSSVPLSDTQKHAYKPIDINACTQSPQNIHINTYMHTHIHAQKRNPGISTQYPDIWDSSPR